MRFVAVVGLVIGIWASIAGVQGNGDSGKAISIDVATGEVVVPAGRIWKVDGLRPYESEKGIGTADLYIDGQVFLGPDQDLTVSGQFNISLSRKQHFPLWILEDSKVRVGDSRGQLTVREYVRK
jgi:hypothetical protein